MTKTHPVLVLAIPAYNESDGIADFLVDIDQYADLWPGTVGAVVVDDCSTDDTSDRVLVTAGKLEHLSVTVERREVNRGHGPTLVEALERSVVDGADVVLTVDGDGQFEASDLYRVAREILVPGMEVAIGV